MNTKSTVILLASCVSFLMIISCKHEPIITPDNNINDTTHINKCDPDTVYFQNDILPLLRSSCASAECHNSESAEDGVIIIDYASLMETVEVRPGEPNESELLEIITETDADEIMPPPPDSPLTAEQISLIEKWIRQGAKNNSCESQCDTLNVTFSGSVWPTMEKYCTGCHSGSNPDGDIYITNYNEVVSLALDGSLLGTIRHDQGYVAMPENGQKIADCLITEIKIWIEDGTPEN